MSSEHYAVASLWRALGLHESAAVFEDYDFSPSPLSEWQRLLFRKMLIHVTFPISLVITMASPNAPFKQIQAAQYLNSKIFLVGVLPTI